MRPDWPPGWRILKLGSRKLGSFLKETLVGIAVSTWLLGLAAPLQAAPSAQITISVHILNPPNAITDLVASPVGTQDGDIQLSWTAPSNQNGATINNYHVRYATFPAVNTGLAETWWTQLSTSDFIVTPAHAPGTPEFTSLHNLTLGVTYYFGIKSTDADGQISPIDVRVGTVNQARSKPLQTGSSQPPAAPTNFTGMALSTASVIWSWTASTGASFYTLNMFPSGTLVDQSTFTSVLESSQSPNVPLSRTVRAGNANGLSAPSSVVTVYTWAASPSSPTFTNVQFSNITLSWNAGGNPAGTQYRLERSLDGSNFFAAALTSSLTYQDTGLTQDTTYFYRVRAINGDGILTQPTVAISTQTRLKTDSTPPNTPMGLKGILDPTGHAFTLTWEEVMQNSDGSPLTDLAGYNVYRRTTLNGSPIRLTATPLTISAFADQVNNQIFYYTVRAIDTSGNESNDSLFADSSPNANVIFVATDSASSVVMPKSVNDVLRSDHNKYGVPLSVQVAEIPIPPNTNILRQIRLEFIRGDTFQALNDTAFTLPEAVVSVGFNVVNGAPAPGAPVSGQSVSASGSVPQPSLYWYNGVTYVKVGGTLDSNAHTLSIKSSYLGTYQIRSTAQAESLVLDQANVYPRLFTPNGDGFNDNVFFVLENPNNSSVSGDVFDLAGRFVAHLKPLNGIGTTLYWDGKDLNGIVVPSGAYLYKVQGEGKTFTGTVGVAR